MATQTLVFATCGTTVTASVTYDDVTLVLQSAKVVNNSPGAATVVFSGGPLSSPTTISAPSGATQSQNLPSTLAWIVDVITGDRSFPCLVTCSLSGPP